MVNSLYANPGQTVTLVVQTTDGYGDRIDGYVPRIENVYFPTLTTAAGYPRSMNRLELGVYYYNVQLPSDSTALGTFIINIFYRQPGSNAPVWEVFTIQVARAFGNSSVSPA